MKNRTAIVSKNGRC